MQKHLLSAGVSRGGEGGIRTRERGFGPVNRLAGGPNQPLWHLPRLFNSTRMQISGGGRGIRTPGGREPTVVFKTTALVRSAIPPGGKSPLCCWWQPFQARRLYHIYLCDATFGGFNPSVLYLPHSKPLDQVSLIEKLIHTFSPTPI